MGLTATSSGVVRDPFYACGSLAGVINFTGAAQVACLNQIPASRLDPNAIKLLNLYPALTGPGIFTNYSADRVVRNDVNHLDVRVDQDFSAKNQMFGRVTYSHDNDFVPGPFTGIADGGSFNRANYHDVDFNSVLSVTHVFLPTMINELHWGYSRIHFSGGYDLPFGRGRRFGRNAHGAFNQLVGGWSTNWILTLESGFPFTVGCPIGTTSTLGCDAFIVPGQNVYAGPHNVNQWLNPSAFANPPVATTVGQTDLAPLGGAPTQAHGPGFHRLDFSIFKQFQTTERTHLEFRAEFFNLTNTPQFSDPSFLDFTNTKTFGRITGLRDGANDPRQIQFAFEALLVSGGKLPPPFRRPRMVRQRSAWGVPRFRTERKLNACRPVER